MVDKEALRELRDYLCDADANNEWLRVSTSTRLLEFLNSQVNDSD